MGAGFSFNKKVTVENGVPQVVAFRPNAPVERLTIWANSGRRVLTDVDFQPRVNGVAYGAPVTVAAAPAADVIYRSGGSSADNDLIPFVGPSEVGIDPFEFDVLVTDNTALSTSRLTLHFVGIYHQG